MTRLEGDADLAVGLEAADAGPVPGTRIDDDERPARRIDFDTRRRNDSHEPIIDRAIKRSAVEHQLDLIVEHMGNRLGQMLAVLIAALAHDVPEQNGALRRIHHVFYCGSKYAEWRGKCADRR